MTAAEIASLLEARMGLAVSPREAAGLDAYLALLLCWNARMNLTAIRDPEQIVLRHFGESLSCARRLALPDGATLLDYGSGAGFPGMVCALAQPAARCTLAESQGRKAAFLNEVRRELRLTEVAVHAGRVAALPMNAQFDVVTLRAVDSMADACMEAAGRVVVGGRIAVLTTTDAAVELADSLPGLEWDAPTPLPASADRVLALGWKC